MTTLAPMKARALQPARIRLARTLRGLTQKELAEKLGVSAATISQYEGGASAPQAAALERLGVALGVTSEFFTRPWRETEATAPFFRSLRSTPQTERDRARSYARLLAEIVMLIDQYVELPDAQFDVALRLDDDAPLDLVEDAASRVRHAWSVAPGPVPHVVRALERHGAIVMAVGSFDERLDAFSMRSANRPIVVLCSKRGAAARRRFDAAHELGHLVLHERPLDANRAQEDQAHRFAAAFLMPAEQVAPWLIRRSSQLDVLEEGSRLWGVSMQALVRRAKDVGTLSESQYTRAMQRMTARGWRTREPVEMGPPERPQLVERATETLTAAGVSVADIAAQVGLPRQRLARMLQVPEDRPDSNTAAIVTLAAHRDRAPA